MRTVDHHDRLVCDECGFVFYRNPVPAAGVIVIAAGQVLMVERKFEPRCGMWTLPAGFMEWGEGAEACAVRELKEETNLDVELIRLFGAYGAHDDVRTEVVLLLYLGRRVGGTLRYGDDASDARFFPVDGVPDNIAFAAHRDALRDIKEYVNRPGS